MSLIPHFFGDRRRSTATFHPFSLDLFDPFPSFPPLSSSSSSSFLNARVDWRETPSSHVFKADVPGLRKEELKVEVEDGRILQISGERKLEKEEKDDTWHRIERSSGKFVRRFRLPEDAKVEEVKAKMADGVLTVMVPKVEVKRENVRAVTIDG